MSGGNYWDQGPNVDLLQSLVNSGMISSKTPLPKIPQQKTPEKHSNKPLPRITVKCSPSLRASSGMSLKSKTPIPTVNSQPTTRSSTGQYLQPSYKNQHAPDGVVYQEPNFLTKDPSKETLKKCSQIDSQELLRKYDEILSQIDTANFDNLPSEDQYEIEKKLISANLFILDDAIRLVKTYNADIAFVIVRVKQFFQAICDQVPEIAQKSADEAKRVMDQNGQIWAQKRELETQYQNEKDEKEEVQTILQKTIEKLRKAEQSLSHHDNVIQDLEYKNADLTQKLEENMLRYSKISEKKEELSAKLKQLEKDHGINVETLKMQEETIKKYEEEGASFKPLYNKTMEDFLKLKKEFDELQIKFKEASFKAQTTDIGTDPLISAKELRKQGKKNSKKQIPQQSSPSGLRPIVSSRSKQNLLKIENPLSLLETTPKKNALLTKTTEKFGIKQTKIKKSVENILEVVEEEDITEEQKDEKQKKEQEEKEAKELKEQKEEKENEKQSQSKEKEKEEQNSIVKVQSTELIQLKEFEDDPNLPPDYCLDPFIDDNVTMIEYVNRLLSIQPEHSGFISDHMIDAFNANGEEKSFSWTLRQVITIFKGSFENDSLQDSSPTFKNIVFNMLVQQCQTTKIVDRIQSNLNCSILAYRDKSKAMQFYLRFASGEYSVTDFRFFCMIFNMLFRKIYPSIDQIIEDPELFTDHGLFTIHLSYSTLICKSVLRIDSLPKEDIDLMLKSAPNSKYPNMVSFWTMVEVLIKGFQKSHEIFHQTISNSLIVIGWTDSDFVCKEHFFDFMKIVKPFLPENDIKSLWKNLASAHADSTATGEVIPRIAFMKFCGEGPGMANAVFEVPSCPTFQKKIAAMSEPLSSLYSFLRRRYSSFLSTLYFGLTIEVSKQLKKSILRVRNAIMNCDISTALMYYTHILQLSDLRCTEMSPILIVTTSATSNDVLRIQNQLMMRESLAAHHINIDVNNDVDLISQEKQFLKDAYANENNENEENKIDSK